MFRDYKPLSTSSKYTTVYRKVNVVKSLPKIKPFTTMEESPFVRKEEKFGKFTAESIKMVNSNLVVSGSGAVQPVAPFTVSNPSRLVFDFKNAGVKNPDMIKTFENTYEKDSMKLGIFEEKDLRAVVTTQSPDIYNLIVSSDLKSFIIAPNGKADISLMGWAKTGAVEGVTVRQIDSYTTEVMINTNNVRNIFSAKRASNKLMLSFYNLNPVSGNIIKNLNSTPQFSGINLDTSDKKVLNFVIPVKKGISSDVGVSEDGKTFRIILRDTVFPSVDVVISPNAKIVLDAGHGGADVGATYGGIFEKDITLDMTKKVAELLKKEGVKVVLTRSDDSTQSLQDRVVIGNGQAPDAFVSIHVNASEKSDIIGLETHWYHDRSLKLAEIVHVNFSASVASPDRGLFKSKFYVINHTTMPAVLLETGFISNEQERHQLISESRQNETAQAIANGIIMFLASKYDQGKR
ncbi:hypothetical protein AGMMS49573_09330 [Endomicrobiia bacterium]|nr:hypothetical protein AGMMS49573_09330 [Endomicrobiia bacterium]